MIITIILLSIVVLSAVGFTLYMTLGDYPDWDDYLALFFLTTCGVAAFFSLIIGGIQIGVNHPSSIKSKEYALKEQVQLYKNEKLVLESYRLITEGEKMVFTSDITFETVSTEAYYEKIKNYNDDIYRFKTSVKSSQYNRDNAWISWFCSPAYASISDEMLSELVYTIGKK